MTPIAASAPSPQLRAQFVQWTLQSAGKIDVSGPDEMGSRMADIRTPDGTFTLATGGLAQAIEAAQAISNASQTGQSQAVYEAKDKSMWIARAFSVGEADRYGDSQPTPLLPLLIDKVQAKREIRSAIEGLRAIVTPDAVAKASKTPENDLL